MNKITKIQENPIWIKGERNSVLRADNFFISYNKSTGSGHTPFTAIGNMLGGEFDDGGETALVIENGSVFKILRGDWRKDYEQRFPDLEACLKFFDSKKKEHGNNWSTLEEDRPQPPMKARQRNE